MNDRAVKNVMETARSWPPLQAPAQALSPPETTGESSRQGAADSRRLLATRHYSAYLYWRPPNITILPSTGGVMQQPRLATESIAGLRPYQEDAVLTKTLADGRLLVAVADGMGGHAAGEVASALALEALVEALEGEQALDEAFRLANQRVNEKAREPGKQGMGTTMVAVLMDASGYSVANVGDSRGYVISDSGARRITEDHSFVAEALKRGQSEEEAQSSQWKDALTRSIGTDAEVEVDLFGPFPVEENAALLLCSDGLYKTLADSDLRELYVQSGGPRGAAQSLVSAAYERGSDDNITVAIAEFGEVPRTRAVGTMPLEFQAPDEPTVETAGPESAQTEESTTAASAPAHSAAGSTGGGTNPTTSPTRSRPPVGLILGVVAIVAIAVILLLVLLG
jgi:serine/threonine protein phosphatase PrpC